MIGALLALWIAAVAYVAESTIFQSSISVGGLLVGPILGAAFARRVGPDERPYGWVAFRMSVTAVLFGALATTMVLWVDGAQPDQLSFVPVVLGLGLAIFGLPMLAVTMVCAAAWIVALKRLSRL